jgi:hypothetical protein
MRRAVPFLAFAIAAAIVGLAIAVLVRSDSAEPVGRRALTQDPVQVSSHVEPDGSFFGDPIVAQVDVQLDATVVNPDRVSVEAEFTPYRPNGPTTVERVDSGQTTRLTYRYPLRCLAEGCDPATATGVVDFPTGTVEYSYIGDRPGRRLGEEIDWTPFLVTGRVGATATRDIRWRASEESVAPVTYRAEPRTTAISLLALAVALAAAAAALAWLVWGRGRDAESDAAVESQSPLALVLAAARAAATNGDVPRRRRALESVARELRAVGLPELAVEARTLAWAPRPASADEVEELARRTENATEVAR